MQFPHEFVTVTAGSPDAVYMPYGIPRTPEVNIQKSDHMQLMLLFMYFIWFFTGLLCP